MINSNALSQAIMNAVKGLSYTVSDSAPDTFETLYKAPSLIIWSGASDNTIYASREVNWAFRAWHDSIHLTLNAPFTLDGELYVAREQCRLIQSDSVAAILIAEVRGQAEYFAKHGAFPDNQCEFIESYLKGGI